MSPPNLVRYSFFIAIKYISIALMVIFFIVPHITHANEIMYGIQVDEFNDSNSAENRVKALNQLGHNAFYRCESIENNKMLCRVFIDQYPTQKEAENEAEFLKKLELITNYSIRQIGEKVQTVKPDTVKPPAPKPKVAKPKVIAPQIDKSNMDKPKKGTPKTDKPQAISSTRGYDIQVGSYQEKTNAESLITRLKQAGYNAVYSYETVKGRGKFYRVIIKGYGSREDAQYDAESLKKARIISSYRVKASEKTDQGSALNSGGGNVFFLHVHSFKNMANAKKNIQLLGSHGHKAFFIAETDSGETWYNIYIGEYNNEKAAQQVGMELQKKGIISSFKTIALH